MAPRVYNVSTCAYSQGKAGFQAANIIFLAVLTALQIPEGKVHLETPWRISLCLYSLQAWEGFLLPGGRGRLPSQ